MKNRIEKKLIIGYKSDVLFKWALTRDDEQTEELRKTIIAHITRLPVIKTQVKNPEIHPDQMNQYEMRLDILVQLEDGTYVDIEMQNSRLNEYALAKSEAYLANLHGMQLKGTKPQRFHETHQIVFVNDYPTEPFVMVAHMLIRDLDDHRGGGKMQAHYIYLPYIDDIVKEKGLDGLDKMEAIYYVFQHNDNRDILELAKKYQEVAMLMEKKDAFNNDLDMYMLAAQRLYAYEDFDEYKKIVLEEEIKKATIKAQKTAFDQGLKEGFDQGLKKGFDQGLKDGFNQGQKEGFDQGQKEGFDQGQKEGFDQ
ncbi:MAG: PD-(D/E)XK nuclease family transposase, partial [bacterium]